MKISTSPDPLPTRQIALYGPPKVGKTRTATSLPWGPLWGEKAIYVAWDPGSAALESVLPKHRSHLVVVAPSSKTVAGRVIYDPLEEAITIATHDWFKEVPEARTIIWDTMTETSYQLLRAYADSGQFSDKHITVGKPGTPSYHANPMEGDFGLAQSSTLFIMERLLQSQPHMNHIVLFHDLVVEPKKGADPRVGGIYGGPGIAGKAAVTKVAGRFNNLIRQDMAAIKGDNGKIVPTPQIQTQQTGNSIWLVGLRLPTEVNPIPTINLKPDPINFWEILDGAQKAGN